MAVAFKDTVTQTRSSIRDLKRALLRHHDRVRHTIRAKAFDL
jgi:hypothetical protein